MKKPTPKVGRPTTPAHLKRTHGVRFNDAEKEAFDKLGYTLVDGVRAACNEFFTTRGVNKNESN